MPLIIDQEWNEVEKTLQKPLVLSLWEDNTLIMTLTWEDWEQESLPLEKFLDLTDIELREVDMLSKLWFTLVWDRRIWSDYPDYFKDFLNSNPNLFVWWKEVYIQRDQFKADTSDVIFSDREKRELILVRLNLPRKTPIEIEEEILNSKTWIQKILEGIWYWKKS